MTPILASQKVASIIHIISSSNIQYIHINMASSREVQYSSASAGVYGTGVLLASRDEPWTLTTMTSNQETEDPNSETTLKLPCSFLQTGVSIRVVPMARQTGGWSDIHFHPQLRLPASQSPEGGMTVLLDGRFVLKKKAKNEFLKFSVQQY